MPSRAQVTIVDVGYRSTHFWVVSAGRSRLLFDLGWPGSMGLMWANLERMVHPPASGASNYFCLYLRIVCRDSRQRSDDAGEESAHDLAVSAAAALR